MRYGNRFKAVRLARGETQEEFSKQFGVHKSTLGHWERGYSNPKKHHVRKMIELEDAVKRDEVEVLKEKKGYATVIKWQGQRYILQHPDQFKR